MNLNPLKKDSNTDALVKALEDANNMGSSDPVGAQPAAGAGAQADAVAAMPSTDSTATADQPAADVSTVVVEPGTKPDDSAKDTEDEKNSKDDASSSLAFTGNDLPGNLSSDADAHLPNTDAAKTLPSSSDDKDLDSVKKSALEQLRPLIEKIDLEPVEKFDKYLMMLRASDDPALIEPAFKAAEQIAGEEEKAQALLDIINEINYITASKQQ